MVMKKIILILAFAIYVFAQTIHLNNFTTDLFSKINKEPEEITLSLVINGRYVQDEKYKVIDALNIVIGSFYAEELLTSQGKESFKKLLIEYAAKKHSVDIDNIYILKLKINQNLSTNNIINILKKSGCCQNLAKK